MIIDAHNHADWLWRPYDKVIKNMDQYNIDVSWLLSCERPENEYFIPEIVAGSSIGVKDVDCPFEKCINYYEKNPKRFVLGFAPDPRLPNALNRLKVAMSFYDAKIVGEFKFRMMIDNYDAVEMFRYAGENGMPVVLHLEEPKRHEYFGGNTLPRATYWYSGGIEALERVLKLCPNTTFLGHAPSFWGNYLVENPDQVSKSDCKYVRGKVLDLLDKNKNLCCDISAGSGITALKKDVNFTRKFMTDYCDRILYGRDCYDNSHQEFINSLGLDQEVKDRIYFKNALDLVPLDHRKVPLSTEEFWDMPE
jgi:predicted TIM-barrel fold metal-dependent hydrolase